MADNSSPIITTDAATRRQKTVCLAVTPLDTNPPPPRRPSDADINRYPY